MCWGPGDPATTMVMLNEHGQLVDVLYAGQLSGSIRRTRRNAQGVDDIFSDPAKVWPLHASSPALSVPSRCVRRAACVVGMTERCGFGCTGPGMCHACAAPVCAMQRMLQK